ncbi:MAG: universal stress protein [Acidiferrobacterales bacterium]|nr:universal stress protein [Acidiferrobacterales bacterium]
MKTYTHILLPLDFSEKAVCAAERARELAHFYDANLSILHAIDYMPPTYMAAEIPATLSSKAYLVEKARAHLDQWATENDLEDCLKIVEIGPPKRVIIQAIKDNAYDLVLLSPNDNSVIGRFFGSVTNAIAQNTDCDVLILRK